MSLTLLCMLSLLLDDDVKAWPGFLGAGANAIPPESIALEWAPDRNIAWKATLPGYGQSSPVIRGDRVWVTSVEGPLKETCHVVALDMANGKQIWKHSLESSTRVESTNYVSRAAPTPVVDASSLYVFFESGDLLALEHDGDVRWKRSLSSEIGEFKNRFGLGGSLAQTRSAIHVLVDHEGPSYLLAVAKESGKTLWKTDRASRMSWSSPAVVTVGGEPQIVVSSSGSVDGYDPATGKLLWSRDDIGGNTVTTPIPYGDGLFLVGASAGERGQFAEVAPRSNVAIRVTEQEGEFRATTLWTAERALASFASPVVHAGHAYWVNRAGVVFCFDAMTGEQKYSGRIAESCWATPLGVGDRIYFFGRRGTTTVLASGPELRKIAENRLWDPEEQRADGAGRQRDRFGGRTVYGVAAVPGSLLIRTGDTLHCVREEGVRSR